MRTPPGAHHRQVWCVLSRPRPGHPMTLDAYQRVAIEGCKRTRRGDEMSQSAPTSAATPDVIQDVEPTVVTDAMSHAPAFISQQAVVFSTAAARSSRRPATISRRVIDAIRVVGAPPRRP